MSFINNLLASGGALLLAGLGILAMKLAEVLPRRLAKVSEVLMFLGPALILFGGSIAAYGGFGTWITSVINFVGSWLGTLAGVVLALYTGYLVIQGVKAAVHRRHEKMSFYLGIFMIPVLFTFFTFGIFHTMGSALHPLAQEWLIRIDGFFGVRTS